jgi:hypothetical protein
MTLRSVGSPIVPSSYLTTGAENLKCLEQDYRLAVSEYERRGCFISSAFGQMDALSNTAIFAGSSGKGLPISSYSANQVLIAWPNTNTVLAMNTLPTGGVQLGVYSYFTAVLTDQVDVLGRVIGKRVSQPPNFMLSNSTGQFLTFNPNTIAFSDHGYWLAGETLEDVFVRINLATLNVVSFAGSFISLGNAPKLNESQIAITDNGRYIAVSNSAATSLRVYDLADCSSPSRCSSYDYWPFVGQQIPDGSRLGQLRFINNGLLSFQVNSGQLRTSYLLAPVTGIESLLDYLALGDSFSSGEGAYEYLPGTDTENNNCHLSNLSYPLLISRERYTTVGGKSVACSGARIGDILAKNSSKYRGQARDGVAAGQRSDAETSRLLGDFTPGYLAQSEFVGHYLPGLLTTGISGNDIGFGKILAECGLLHLTRTNTCYDTYEDRVELARLIDRQVPRLVDLYTRLKALDPLGKLYAVGYPQLLAEGDCALNVRLNSEEIKLAISLTNHLNAAVREAARQAGINYVDISLALEGHRLCESNSNLLAVHGLTAGNDTGPVINVGDEKLNFKLISSSSYHPNSFGQELIKRAILAKTNNFFTAGVASSTYSPAMNDSAGLLNAQKTGRPTSVMSFNTISDSTIQAGKPFEVSLDGTENGFRPNTAYSIRLDGTNGSTLATLTAGSQGDLVGSVTLPADLAPGTYTIDVTGNNLAGEPINIRQIIYLPVVTPATTSGSVTDNPSTPPETAIDSSNLDAEIPKQMVAATITTFSNRGNGTQPPTIGTTLGLSTVNPQKSQNQPQLSVNDESSGVASSELYILHWLPWLYLLIGAIIVGALAKILVTQSKNRYWRPSFAA